MFQRQGGVFYWQDTNTGRQGSLGTKDKHAADKLLHAKNESHEQPILNLALAKAYASAHDPKMATRTWREVMAEMASHGRDSTQARCKRAMNSKAFDAIRDKNLIATTSDDLLSAMRGGKNSVNHYLRRLHNLAVNLGWLAWPILAKRAWPKVITARRRAVTREEHERIIAAENNPERRAYYELLWETGCSQTDAANLSQADIDWSKRILVYHRMKLSADSEPARLTIGNRLLALLRELPSFGLLFPNLAKLRNNDRATDFARRCNSLKISGVSRQIEFHRHVDVFTLGENEREDAPHYLSAGGEIVADAGLIVAVKKRRHVRHVARFRGALAMISDPAIFFGDGTHRAGSALRRCCRSM